MSFHIMLRNSSLYIGFIAMIAFGLLLAEPNGSLSNESKQTNPLRKAEGKTVSATLKWVDARCDYMPMFAPGTHGRFWIMADIELENHTDRQIRVKLNRFVMNCPSQQTKFTSTNLSVDRSVAEPCSTNEKLVQGHQKVQIRIRCNQVGLNQSVEAKNLEQATGKTVSVLLELSSGNETLKIGDSTVVSRSS